jgi:uncharacterized protein involved in exopolysaccharide biosynthesis
LLSVFACGVFAAWSHVSEAARNRVRLMKITKPVPLTRVAPENPLDPNIVVTIDRGTLDTAFAREATVTSLLRALWRLWWVWLSTILALASLGYAFAVTQPELYSASAVLFPPPREAALAQFPTRLLGLNLGSTSPTTDEALATLSSSQFLGDFVEKHNLLPVLFPSLWDPTKRAWRPEVVREPTLLRGVRELRRNLEIEEDVTSPVVSLTLFHIDPDIAATVVNNLVADLNTTMRERAIARSRAIVDQYYQQLRSDTVTEVRSHILSLITDEMKTLVTARGTEEFAFRVIDPAAVPEFPSYPNKPLVFALACLLGLFTGVFLTLLLHFFRGAEVR